MAPEETHEVSDSTPPPQLAWKRTCKAELVHSCTQRTAKWQEKVSVFAREAPGHYFDFRKVLGVNFKNHDIAKLGDHYFKSTDSNVRGGIFSGFAHTSGSIERLTNCSLEKTEALHLNGETVIPNTQYLEGRFCQGFLVRVIQIVWNTSDAVAISIS